MTKYMSEIIRYMAELVLRMSAASGLMYYLSLCYVPWIVSFALAVSLIYNWKHVIHYLYDEEVNDEPNTLSK